MRLSRSNSRADLKTLIHPSSSSARLPPPLPDLEVVGSDLVAMQGRALLWRTASFRPENLGQSALQLIANLCFALFVLGVLAFTIIAATYQPEDPLLHPSNKLTSFLTSTSNATFRSDDSTTHTGDDFLFANSTAELASVITLFDINTTTTTSTGDSSNSVNTEGATDDEAGASVTPAVCADGPVDCKDAEIFHTMMRAAIEMFADIHFYRFGKPARGADDGKSCDMAWRFRPKNAKRAGFYKDYRRFEIARSSNCTLFVASIGDYHSGVNARKKRKSAEGGEFKAKDAADSLSGTVVPVVGEAVNDALPVVESESKFISGRYLIYTGGGDRCKSMNHYLWSFLCALGEAQYLNRTLIMDLNICLNSMYSLSNQDEEGKDFRFYFDFEHLRDSTSVLDQRQFWDDWNKWQKNDKLTLYLVEDFRITPMKLASVKETLIMRKFGTVEPDNYWYRVCEGETESVIQRPWNLIWKSRRLMDIVSGVASRMSWDYDAVHIVRGEKAKNTGLWPNLASDTSPLALLSTLRDKIEDGRHLYIATNESETSFFDPLKDKYTTHFLDDFKDLWDESSEWYAETKKLNGAPIEFDGYMRVEVDTEVFLRGKKQIETFNDLTSDCKDGVNTCRTAS
ncbi:hypothetical protein AXF42_Ash019911 [Apostasia shenzhenica]|uniref:O-fucosyltransferase family protein n=1 Tax=Apostasia shenzhenica TaxID=1088818 RepID=A0A2H9ZYR7_9ASPA|nr:hypothetical protein AXF42_Ash019911 [Apostasia shenzhenica]